MRDLVRIAGKVKITGDATSLGSAVITVYELLMRTLQQYVSVLPFYDVWGALASFIYRAITELWLFLTGNSEKPSTEEPPVL